MTSVPDEPLNVIYGLSCTCHPERGIRYVGLTIRGANSRLSDHRSAARGGKRSPVCAWIRRHGPENIIAEVLEVHEAADTLGDAEVRLIDELGTHVSRGGVNHSTGGSLGPMGFRHSAASRAKMSARQRGRKPSPELRAKLREASRKGERHLQAKLTDQDVTGIKERIWDGESLAELAREFGVSHGTMSNISRSRSRKHIAWPTDRERTIVSISERHLTIPDDAVREVRRLHDEGVPLKKIAEMTGVNATSAYLIFSGQRYQHVT